mmetsp:Transcript_13364/g.21917  ORF Transcript_13364/g.21917 Transcript_13364/m.21917 type:complete len:203 (-) Transcript_13364:2920-3528(-)
MGPARFCSSYVSNTRKSLALNVAPLVRSSTLPFAIMIGLSVDSCRPTANKVRISSKAVSTAADGPDCFPTSRSRTSTSPASSLLLCASRTIARRYASSGVREEVRERPAEAVEMTRWCRGSRARRKEMTRSEWDEPQSGRFTGVNMSASNVGGRLVEVTSMARDTISSRAEGAEARADRTGMKAIRDRHLSCSSHSRAPESS